MEPEIEDHAIIDPLLEREGKKKKRLLELPTSTCRSGSNFLKLNIMFMTMDKDTEKLKKKIHKKRNNILSRSSEEICGQGSLPALPLGCLTTHSLTEGSDENRSAQPQKRNTKHHDVPKEEHQTS